MAIKDGTPRRSIGQRLTRMLLAVYGPAQVSPPDPRDDVDRARQMRGRSGTTGDLPPKAPGDEADQDPAAGR